MKFNRVALAALAALMSVLLLAACGDPEPEETEASPTTGNAEAFEVEGEVLTVAVEDEEASPEATSTAGAGTAAAETNIRARLVIQVDSMKAETMELCDVDEGDEITLTLTDQSLFDQNQEPADLGDLEGRTIRAEGNAEELAAGDSAPQTGQTGTATPAETASPTQAASPEAEGTATAADAPGGGTTEDPEAGCHYEVVKISVNEEEPDTGLGDSTSSPTPAPAGNNDVPGSTTTPGAADRPNDEASPAATPGGNRIDDSQ